MTTLVIDNYDSFTFNLVQLLAGMGQPTLVLKNDDLDGWQALDWDAIERIIVSPGPGSPSVPADLGLSRDAILSRAKPLLGVCLGHQALCHLSGGTVRRAPEPVHGRTSRINHAQDDLFAGIPNGFLATRYHSLIVTDVPDEIECTAWSDDGLLMAVRHRDWPAWGVQFHPESIGSEYGARLLDNFVTLSSGTAAQSTPRPPTPLAPRRGTSTSRAARLLRTHWVELDTAPDPAASMRTLFPDVDVAFWIDTLSLDRRSAQLSYVGAGCGPGSETVSYRVEDGFVRAVSPAGSAQEIPGSMQDHLAARLAEYQAPDRGPVPFNLGYVGWLGYELRDLGGPPHHRRAPHPDAFFVLADRMLIIDHASSRAWLAAFDVEGDTGAAAAWLEQSTQLLATMPLEPPLQIRPSVELPQVTFRHDVPGYLERIALCQELIAAGESYELCLTNQLSVGASVEPLDLFRVLRTLNPAPFATFLRTPEVAVVGASPERFLTVDGGVIVSKPMKGTRRRGADPIEDDLLREELASSVKERAENLMITDLVRNDLGSVARPGSVRVDQLFGVETYRHVHQLVSTVSAVAADGVSLMDVVAATFPGGSMTGAPKRRSTELLDELEGGPRGIYSGATGFVTFDDRLDLSMVIRTAVVTPDDVTVGVGGAITALSDPEEEVAEMQLKGAAVLRAIGAVARLRSPAPG